MCLTEAAEASTASPATAYRILITLRKHTISEFAETSQLWHFGSGAFRIGTGFLRRTRLVEQSRFVMERMMAETVNLVIIDRAMTE